MTREEPYERNLYSELESPPQANNSLQTPAEGEWESG